MLVLGRKDGQWLEVTHKSGDVLRILVFDIGRRAPGHISVGFDDAARNFRIVRAEVLRPREPDPVPVPQLEARPCLGLESSA